MKRGGGGRKGVEKLVNSQMVAGAETRGCPISVCT